MYFQHEMCTYTNPRLFKASTLPPSDHGHRNHFLRAKKKRIKGSVLGVGDD